MRGHFAVGLQRREEGEEGKEGSAWMARLSAPARRFRHASYEEGVGRREKRGVRGWRA